MSCQVLFSRVLFVQALQTSSKTNARECTPPKLKTLETTVWKSCQLWKLSRSADVKIQPKARDYLFKIQHFRNFLLVSLSPHPRSHRGAERIWQGKGCCGRRPKSALEGSDWTEKFQFRESHTEAETKKTPDQIPVLLKKRIIIGIDTRAPHGCRHSPAPMLRVGQGSTLTSSIQHSIG